MKTSQKNKKRIYLKINPVLDELLEGLSSSSSSSKSAIVENALSDYLDKKLADDSKFLAEMKFEDLPDENDWLKIKALIK
jgi:predicted transcriptional regulator